MILLGFLEKIFFVAEYGSANEGHDCEYMWVDVVSISTCGWVWSVLVPYILK